MSDTANAGKSDRAAHTPGPWKAEKTKITVPGRQGFRGDYRVADAYSSSAGLANTPSFAEACANAALIARAPDMQAEIDRLSAINAELVLALKPFAAFLDALEVMGGNTPRTGAFYTLSTVAGERDITVEDLKAARVALARSTMEK